MTRSKGRRLPTVTLTPTTAGDGSHGLTIEVGEGCGPVFGTKIAAFVQEQLARLVGALSPATGHPSEQQLRAALAMVAAVKPRNELEAALAVQIAVTHAVSLDLVGRASRSTDPHTLDARTTAATKFQRTLLAQFETLHRMRRGGKQVVTVQHVQVNGGQAAVIGQVTGGRRGRSKTEDHPHELALAAALAAPAGGALRCPEPVGSALPGAEGPREGEVLAPRRSARHRSTTR